jgi:hypothetical protein
MSLQVNFRPNTLLIAIPVRRPVGVLRRRRISFRKSVPLWWIFLEFCRIDVQSASGLSI